jgi:outer membrane protein OmpA-like peptidoglycan-associated protein
MARELRKVGIERIRVEGHTDNLGSRSHNLELSRRRAEVVAQAFVASGFPDAGIERKAWGFAHPAASNDSPEGRALNRRVAIVVVAAGPAAD